MNLEQQINILTKLTQKFLPKGVVILKQPNLDEAVRKLQEMTSEIDKDTEEQVRRNGVTYQPSAKRNCPD